VRTLVKLLLLPGTAALLGCAAVIAGLIDFSAVQPPGKLEERLATFALDRSIAAHAPKSRNPLAGRQDAVEAGLALFRVHCVQCHGAPGVDPTEAGASLNPPAPGLTLPRIQERPDGELYWIVSRGIRMTGMPAFGPSRSEDEIWRLVAALRQLPRLTDQEKSALRAGQ
jgi:mono/diheme cytochrome c family protein